MEQQNHWQIFYQSFDVVERETEAWKKSRNFTQSMAKKDITVHFTYFISGVYFVNNEKRNLYTPPGGKGRGRSAIGWGGTPQEINLRLEQLNIVRLYILVIIFPIGIRVLTGKRYFVLLRRFVVNRKSDVLPIVC